MITPAALAAYMVAAPALRELSHEEAVMVVRSLEILIPEPVRETPPERGADR